MKKCLAVILTISFYSFGAFAQDAPVEKKGVIYHDEFSMGFRLNTLGWAMFGDIGKQQTVDKKRIYRFEIVELKHPKEFKQPTAFTTNGFSSAPSSKPYYFGKQNSFYALHFGYGHNRMIADKPLKNGVAVSYSYSFGPSLGLAKPYYLEIIYPIDNTDSYYLESERYDPENPEKFTDPFSIYGASGFSYGIGELRFYPGLHGKFGMNFDWAVYDDVVKVFEVGIAVDGYLKKVPIMIIDKNQQIFANLYLSFQLGRKW